jgi:hypothetical protein
MGPVEMMVANPDGNESVNAPVGMKTIQNTFGA